MRPMGSPTSSLGDANGLLDTEREVRPFRDVELDMVASVGSGRMDVPLLTRHMYGNISKGEGVG